LNLFEGIDIYTHARFEELCLDLFRITLAPVEKVLRDSKIDKPSIKLFWSAVPLAFPYRQVGA
jgi:hypothetical protein